MTPRYDWTWHNFFASAAIRFYCKLKCACDPDSDPDTMTGTLWKFVADHELTIAETGGYQILKTGSSMPLFDVLPSQQGMTAGQSGACGANHDTFCPTNWPDSFGPIPLYPPDTTEAPPPPPPAAPPAVPDLTACGASCQNSDGCKPSSEKVHCFCAWPSFADAAVVRLNYPSAGTICLGLAMTAIKNKPIGGLGGRDLKERYVNETGDVIERRFVDSRGEPYICPCNATYKGNECCGNNGRVWLDFR